MSTPTIPMVDMPTHAPSGAACDVLSGPTTDTTILAVAATHDAMREAHSIARRRGAETAWGHLESRRAEHPIAVETSGIKLDALTGLLIACHRDVPTDLSAHLGATPEPQRLRIAYAAHTLRWGGNHQRARNIAAFLAAWDGATA